MPENTSGSLTLTQSAVQVAVMILLLHWDQ